MSRSEKIQDFFKNHQDKIILTIGFVMVCSISFTAGRLSVSSKSESVTIDESNIFENTKSDNSIENIPKNTQEEKNTIENKEKTVNTTENEGVFVGNTENNKFYPFNSKEIGDIANDNIMWFDSKEEAEEQGYILGQNKSTSTIKSEDSDRSSTNNAEKGKYVGSKNSDKYHALDSGPAKRIKEENKVYFKSKEDAESQGYEAGTSVKD